MVKIRWQLSNQGQTGLHKTHFCLAGGAGVYEVIKCGSFGHNIRSRPNLKASPVGRLTMANQITVVEEVCYKPRLKKACFGHM